MLAPLGAALRLASIHRPLQAGIYGSPDEGAESIVSSDYYGDDIASQQNGIK